MVEDLVPDDARHFEALLACDRVDDHVAVDTDEVLRIKNAVLILVGVVMLALFTCQGHRNTTPAQRGIARCNRSCSIAQS